MKRIIVLSGAVLTMAIGGLFFNTAQAQQTPPSLSPEHQKKIEQNCVAAQVSMQRTQASDAVARTLRGREYEDISKLMTAFNSRVASNRLSIPGLSENLATLSRISKNDFFNNYTAYANAIDAAIKLDCKNNPAEFYEQVISVRSMRAALKADVDRMAQTIEAYKKSVNEFRATLTAPQPAAEGAAQ